MLYFASYKHPEHWHGLIYQISISRPKNIWVDGELDLFKPSQDLLSWWKKSAQNRDAQRQYTQRYYAELNPDCVKAWIDQFKVYQRYEHDLTFLCWEEPGEFCHRNLVSRIIEKHMPWLLGGRDIRQLEEGDKVEWPVQDGGNLEWLKPFTIKAIEYNQASLAWVNGPVNLAELRLYGSSAGESSPARLPHGKEHGHH